MDRRIADTPEIDWTKYPMPRVRHHVNSQAYLPASQHHRLPAWYPPVIDSVEWGSWFANGRPADVLDIGCGRGAFLLRHALAYPDLNILGLEVRQTLTEWIKGVIQGEKIGNAHAEWYSMANGLDWIATGSVQYAVYLFPDPWPKNRHHKRRAFNEDFLKHLHRVLVPGGRIWLASDRQEVVDHQNEILSSSELFTVVHPQEHAHSEDEWPFPFTTDQQMFCDDKGIPYVRYYAERRS
ncbi:MAG: hypothetical protein IPH85_01505 [Ignavibacteria bacterium]|nr:hypothetical protein [Ignavibacteria bacterium]MBP7094058.1 hypothetical protein [Candidatus Kapabacteria bacterium]MBK6419662.1 hypothetical protein [Ignavibacteria bacterium]MBK6759706.1 hypothetical protein [Ignavibacteria bacterium]MBK7033104.1 hypothetical protein [Ignavibacteria bacterium]